MPSPFQMFRGMDPGQNPYWGIPVRIRMPTLEETIKALTSRTPSGGSCAIGDSTFIVRYCSDSWEWEYRGNIYYDPQDLAEAILRKSDASSRLARYFTGRIPDQRRAVRTLSVRPDTATPSS